MSYAPVVNALRVVSWNVNARRDCAGQVAALSAFAPDLVGLQEVTVGSDAGFRECLAAAGLTHYASGAAMARKLRAPVVAKRYSAFASRYPFRVEQIPGLPRPELAIAARLQTPLGRLRIVNVHVPTWSNGREAKILTQELVCEYISARRGAMVLMGDFNSPKDELKDGTVVAFTRPKDVRGRIAELALLSPRISSGRLRDAYRAVNGWSTREESWYWKNRGRTGGFRLDHVFASKHLRPVACWYEHDLRLARMSDHSPVFAEFERI
jgi:endonuclease/exonuclease/phosphatase family metal-dependent hydrolase